MDKKVEENENKKDQSLADLRSEIDQLEEQLTQAKRQQLIIAEERSPTQEIYSWEAPERSFRPKTNKWYAIVGGVSFIGILLAVLTGTFLLVIAIIAVLAVMYSMNTIPPRVFKYTILNKGLKAGDKVYTWKQIPEFWITERGQDIFLFFDIVGERDDRLMILVGEGNIGIIAKELIRYIDYLDPSEVKKDFFLNMVEGKHVKLGDLVKDDIEKSPIKSEPVYAAVNKKEEIKK